MPARIRDARPEDASILVRLRTRLWPDSADEHARAIDAYFSGKPTFTDQIVVCENEAAELIGFAELRIRNYAEGSENMTVPYLEGWFVEAAYRKRGIGRLLIAAAEDWALASGHNELASDADIDNQDSIAAHLGSGFQEVERSVSFLKKL